MIIIPVVDIITQSILLISIIFDIESNQNTVTMAVNHRSMPFNTNFVFIGYMLLFIVILKGVYQFNDTLLSIKTTKTNL